MRETEKLLCEIIGEDALKEIGEQIAEIIRKHDLQLHPEICRKLFHYLSDVIDRWNCV